MHKRPRTDGFGYPWTPFRVEHRPTYRPHTKEELLALLDLLAECGVKAWWYAVATKGSYPMFPSKHLPHRTDAVDYLPWLVEEGHKRGIAMFSWEYLATAPLLAHKHDEWGWRYLDGPEPVGQRDKHYFCCNSPYGDLMTAYSIEVVRDLGFDGIWYDGSLLFRAMGAPLKYACCCAFCAAKYKEETWSEIPVEVDLNDAAFRRFLEWRRADFMDYWRRHSAAVRAAKPEAVIAFNHFNRLNHHTEVACPLWRLAGDAPAGPKGEVPPPMEAMVTTERGHWQHQVTLMAKTLRAINDNYPVEVWAPATDSPASGRANVNPAPLLYHARMCATAGAFASFGFGQLDNFRSTLAALSRELGPLAPYVGGEQLPCVGVVHSGATKDYAYTAADGKSSAPETAWKSVFGTEAILGSLHLPTEILLDNMLSEGFLSKFQAVVLPETQCLSDEAAGALTRYVESGGLLVAVGDAGTRTYLGEERDKGALDDLFGIVWRAPEIGRHCAELKEPALAAPFSHEALRGDRPYADGLPTPYGFPGLGRLVRSESAAVLAEAPYQPPVPRRYGPNGLVQPEPDEPTPCAAILSRDLGRGKAVYVVPNLACDEAQWGPFPPVRELYARLLLPHLRLPFTTDAPPDVLVALWHQEGRRVFHLLRLPEKCRTMPWYDFYRVPPEVLANEPLPVQPLTLALPDKGESARAVGNLGLNVQREGGTMRIGLPAFDTHAAVVLEKG